MRRFLMLFAAVLALMTVVMATQAVVAAGAPRAVTKVLVRGAPIHGANGLSVGSHGRLYVASVFGREIVVVNSRTGRILARLGPDEGYNGADDLTFGPDGSLYWTDILAGKVGRLETDGTMTMQDVAPFVNPITFSDDGRLFVAQAFYGDALYELDPELVDPPTLMMTGSGVPPFLDQFNGFDFGPDGMLYAPHPFLGSIVRVDVDAGTQEVVAEGLPFPVAVKFDANGRLYAALQDAGTVVRVKLTTGKTRVVARLEPGLDNLAFDARGRLFVSHGGNGHIWRILPNHYRRHHGRAGLIVRGGLVSPGGIAVMPSKHGGERLYVADGWEMKMYDGRSGRYEGVIRQSFVGASIISPVTVSPDGANLIISSWFSNAVQIWDPKKSAELGRWDDFVVPMNAIRFGDDLIVAELGNVPGAARVVRQAPDGARTTLAGPIFVPTGLAASDDDLWVADSAAGVVYQLVADGVDLATPVPVAAGLAQPEGLAFDRDGTLLVVEAGIGRLTRIDLASGATSTSTVADHLALGAEGSVNVPPTWFFNGVAVGSRGAIYVTGDKRDLVYRIAVCRH